VLFTKILGNKENRVNLSKTRTLEHKLLDSIFQNMRKYCFCLPCIFADIGITIIAIIIIIIICDGTEV
jgi:hypothetical protein